MTVTTVERDPEARTMTLVAEFDASVGRVWELWEDPRQLDLVPYPVDGQLLLQLLLARPHDELRRGAVLVPHLDRVTR